MSIGKTTELSLVNTAQIVDGSVTSSKIAAGAVGSAALASGSVVAASIAAGAVGSAAISSTGASSWYLLTANGSGGVTFKDLVIAVNSQTGTTYTAALADAGRMIEISNASSITFTIPPNSTAAFANGTQIDVLQTGAGQITIAAGTGVTVNSEGAKLKLKAQWAAATIIKRDTNTWVAIGNLSA
jgi:hypothetical protein